MEKFLQFHVFFIVENKNIKIGCGVDDPDREMCKKSNNSCGAAGLPSYGHAGCFQQNMCFLGKKREREQGFDFHL